MMTNQGPKIKHFPYILSSIIWCIISVAAILYLSEHNRDLSLKWFFVFFFFSIFNLFLTERVSIGFLSINSGSSKVPLISWFVLKMAFLGGFFLVILPWFKTIPTLSLIFGIGAFLVVLFFGTSLPLLKKNGG